MIWPSRKCGRPERDRNTSRKRAATPHLSWYLSRMARSARFCAGMENGYNKTAISVACWAGAGRLQECNGPTCSTCALEDDEFSGKSRRLQSASRKNARAQHCVSDHAKALRVNTVESLAVMSSKHHAKRILGAGIAYAGGSWRCKVRRKGVGFSSIYKVCWRFITCCFARLSAQSLATRRDQSLRRVRSRRYR